MMGAGPCLAAAPNEPKGLASAVIAYSAVLVSSASRNKLRDSICTSETDLRFCGPVIWPFRFP